MDHMVSRKTAAEKPKADYVPRNVSEQALTLRELSGKQGVLATVASYYGGASPKVPNIPRLADCNINELSLSVRATNCLMRAGMDTFGKLAVGLEQDGGLFHIRNLGLKSEKEIRTAYIEECYRRMQPYERAEYWQSFLDEKMIVEKGVVNQ